MKPMYMLQSEGEIPKSCRDYLAALTCKESTKRGIVWQLETLLCFIAERGIGKFGQLTITIIEEFFKREYERRRKRSNPLCRNIVIYVRQYLSFLYRQQKIDFNPSVTLFTPAAQHKNAPVCFTEKEMQAIIFVIDRASIKGKRDYAILIIASHTGLRCCDIIDLCFEDIDWQRLEIHLNQSKTGKQINLPIDREVATALSDYILHARPETEDRHIFIRIQKPYRGMQSTGSGNNIMLAYVKKAGIHYRPFDGKRFHALRRTLASNMLAQSIPLTTISQVLGHSDMDSAKAYLSLSHSELSLCCFSLAPFLKARE